MLGETLQRSREHALLLWTRGKREQDLALRRCMKRQFTARPDADFDGGRALDRVEDERSARRHGREHDAMPQRVAQFPHRPVGDLNKVRVGSEPRQQLALGADGVAGRHGVLHQIAALDQCEQMTVHGSFGHLQPFRQLRDAELLAGKGNGLQHVKGELNRTHAGLGAVINHGGNGLRLCSRQ